MIEKLYTVEEVAELASVTGRTIRNYLKSGRLVGRKIGGQWRFPENEVQRLLSGAEPEEQEETPPEVNIPAPAPAYSPEATGSEAQEPESDAPPVAPAPQGASTQAPSGQAFAVFQASATPQPEPPPYSAADPGPAAPPLAAQPAPVHGRPVDSSPPATSPFNATSCPAAADAPVPLQPVEPPAYPVATATPLSQPTPDATLASAQGVSPSIAPSSGFVGAPAQAEPAPAVSNVSPFIPYGQPYYPYAQPAYPGQPYPGQAAAPSVQPVYWPAQAPPGYPTPYGAPGYPYAPASAGPGPSPEAPASPPPEAPPVDETAESETSVPPYTAMQSANGAFRSPEAVADPGYTGDIRVPMGKIVSGREKESPQADSAFKSVSDVGKRILQFVSEAHDCSHGPQICAIVDLHQSFNAAKITNERLADIAEQESDETTTCHYYVEYDERYYVARYTLFGTSSFLLRCLKLIG